MSITIIIQTVSTSPITVQVNQTDTIEDAKRKYVEKAGKDYSKFNQWIFDAEVLENTKKINDYKLNDKDEITANETSRGGLNQLKS